MRDDKSDTNDDYLTDEHIEQAEDNQCDAICQPNFTAMAVVALFATGVGHLCG